LIGFDEPFKKLLNQGMIQGSSRFVYRLQLYAQGLSGDIFYEHKTHLATVFLSKSWADKYSDDNDGKVLLEIKELIISEHSNDFPLLKPNSYVTTWSFSPMYVDVNIVDGIELNINEFKKWKNAEFAEAKFIFEDNGKYICGVETEKMSKSKYNTVNPDELCEKYGADTFRMYEMFLGPVEASKPWDTKGIEGVHRFLRKLWRLFNDDVKGKVWTAPSPSEQSSETKIGSVARGGEVADAELKVLHRTIKKIEEDTERFSFNTAVSTFMICVNDLADLKCHKKEILEKLLILLTPYAPHIAEELWNQLGNEGSVLDAAYPSFNPALLVESTKEYPVSINGKLRTNIELALDLEQTAVEELVLQNEIVQKWLDGNAPKKIIFVKNKMINVVI
jgi:leucyl-tRNA synthetase